jgi:hypothetical protein
MTPEIGFEMISRSHIPFGNFSEFSGFASSLYGKANLLKI